MAGVSNSGPSIRVGHQKVRTLFPFVDQSKRLPISWRAYPTVVHQFVLGTKKRNPPILWRAIQQRVIGLCWEPTSRILSFSLVRTAYVPFPSIQAPLIPWRHFPWAQKAESCSLVRTVFMRLFHQSNHPLSRGGRIQHGVPSVCFRRPKTKTLSLHCRILSLFFAWTPIQIIRISVRSHVHCSNGQWLTKVSFSSNLAKPKGGQVLSVRSQPGLNADWCSSSARFAGP